MSKKIKKILKGIGIFLGTVVGLAVLFVLVLTVTEFRPKDVEEIEILNLISIIEGVKYRLPPEEIKKTLIL